MSDQQILEKQVSTNQLLLSMVLQNQVVIMKVMGKNMYQSASFEKQIKDTEELLRNI